MANLTRLRLPGFWVIGSVVDPEEFEALDAMRELVPNFGGGSTHSPTDPVIIGGDGLNVTGLLDVDGALDQDEASVWQMNGQARFLDNSLLDMRVSSQQVFRTGSLLQILAGADVEVDGTMTFDSAAQILGTAKVGPGGALHVDNTAQLQMLGGSSFVMALGSTGTINGLVTWGNGLWPGVTSRSITRNGWKLAGLTYTGSAGAGPDTPHAWMSLDEISGTPAIRTIASTSNAGRTFVVQLLDLPPGATLVTVTITTRGTSGDSGVDLPTYRLVRWNDSNVFDPMSANTEDAHDPADWTADRENTVVTCTSDAVIDGGYNYGILVIPPAGSTAASMLMYSFKSALTASSIQL